MSSLDTYEPRERTWLTLQNPALELANAIPGTEFVPQSLRNNPAAITAAILYGDEVGLGPMQSLAKIAVINGRPTLAAEAQRALILQAGHELWIEESTTTRCIVAGKRRDSEQISRVTWTMDDAKRAGLAGKPPWRSYPRQMLLARASAELARVVFADAIGGLGATEELADENEDASGTGQVATLPTTGTHRRRSSAGAPRPAEPSSAPAPALPPLPGEEEVEDGDWTEEPDQAAPGDASADPDENEPGGDEDASVASAEQQKMLMATAREHGWKDADRYDLTARICGEGLRSVKRVPKDKVDELLAALRQGPGGGGGDIPLEEDTRSNDELILELGVLGDALSIRQQVDAAVSQHTDDREWLQRQLARLVERHNEQMAAV